MTIFMVETYVVKPEKLAEFTAYKQKWKKSFTKWLKEVKSYKMFTQMLGGQWGAHTEMWEFENLADCEKLFNKVMKSDYQTKLYPEFASLIVPATYSTSIWNPAE